MEFILFPVIIIGGIVVYFLPGIIAARRGHPNADAIIMLVLLLGWTYIGWAVAMVWAVTAIDGRSAPPTLKDKIDTMGY